MTKADFALMPTASNSASSGYYYFDDYALNNPYPTGQGGASVPGFAALNLGRSQLINLGHTKTFGASTVNELRLSFMRSANNVGQPLGGVGPSLASQGFANGTAGGIVPLAPKIEGIENVTFSSYTIGVPITNLTQANNTYALTDHLSKILGSHTFKTGMQLSLEQVNVNPNPTFNGAFTFYGTQTGSDFADFLIGVASNYNQADSQSYYGRHKYAAGFVQDSWRVKQNLTLNYGIRWDLMQYWSEKYNQIPTFSLGQQSKVYPTAPTSLVYPTDAGIPPTLVPQSNKFAPRLGLAYSPSQADGLLGKIFGGPGKTSIRAGYGIFYSVIQGNSIAIDEPQPPYGLSYTSPAPPLFATPFVKCRRWRDPRAAISARVSAAECFGKPSQPKRWTCRAGRERDLAHCCRISRCDGAMITGGATRIGRLLNHRDAPDFYWLLFMTHYTS
jgi:hypothetical protein